MPDSSSDLSSDSKTNAILVKYVVRLVVVVRFLVRPREVDNLLEDRTVGLRTSIITSHLESYLR